MVLWNISVSLSTLSILAIAVVVVNTFLGKILKNCCFYETFMLLYICRNANADRGDIMSGDKIKALRKEAKMTQAQLSKKLNEEFGLKTDRVMVSKWETGFQTPVVSTLACIAKVFGVSLDYLNGTEDEETKTDNNIEAAKVALFSGGGEVTDEMWQEVVNFAKYIEAREAAKNENN